MSVSKTKKINMGIVVFLFLFFLITPTVSLAAEFWFVIQTDAAYSDGYTTESECNSKRISKARNLVASGKGDSLLTECFKYSKSRAFIVKSDYPDFLGDHPTKKASEILAESGGSNWWFIYKYTEDTEYRKKGDHVVAGPYLDQPTCEDIWQKQDKTNIVLVEACRESATKPATPPNNTPVINTDTTYTLLAPLPFMGLDGTDPEIDTLYDKDTNPCPFGKYLNILIKLFLGIAGVLAVIMIVWGGIQYMTSELASSKEEGKKSIRNAILGLLLALGAWLILNTINPDLLNVCLNNLPQVEITIIKDFDIAGGASFDGKPIKVNFNKEAYPAAKIASQKTGVETAFILAMFAQETSNGANTGRCNYLTANMGEGQLAALNTVASRLGIGDISTINMSCSGGGSTHGGAIGYTQFLPGTWLEYSNTAKQLLGHEPNPWNAPDALMMTALFLKSKGGAGTNPANQEAAACKYFGSCSVVVSCGGGTTGTYGQCIMGKKLSIQQQIDEAIKKGEISP